MRILARLLEHHRQRDLITSALRFVRFKLRSVVLSRLSRDWRGFPLVLKAFVLFRWTRWPESTWRKHPELVLRALELENNAILADRRTMDLLVEVQAASETLRPLLSLREMCNLYRYAGRAAELDGDLAEVGVYRGGSAKIICEAKGDRPLRLFDTFCGLPAPDQRVDVLAAGEMSDTTVAQVQTSLSKYPNVHFYPGLFPDSAQPVSDRVFSFVHLDTDLHRSTLDSLRFFYPRLTPGGFILGHDYNSLNTPGVRKAFDEFFADRAEAPVETWDSQCVVVKT